MRLICPNCGAQYEIDSALVPEAGRDVQCSNCGHAWFQKPEHLDEELAEELGRPLSEPPISEPELESDSAEAEDEAPDDAPEIPAAARSVDDEVLDVLREEAAHEQRARAEEQSTPAVPETENVDVDPAFAAVVEAADDEKRAAQARERMARLRGIEPEKEEKSGSRSELLPDIDEINSTLRAESDRKTEGDLAETTTPAPVERRKGFRLGFAVALLVAGILTAAYAYAPTIVQRFPATERVMVAYVGAVNSLRSRVEEGMLSSIKLLSGMLQTDETAPEEDGASDG